MAMAHRFGMGDYNPAALTADSSVKKSDIIGRSQPAGTPANAVRSCTIEQEFQCIYNDAAVTELTSPSGNDLFPALDSASSYALKKVKWSTISGLGTTPSAATLNHTGRLSALSNVATPISSVYGATSIYLVPDVHGPGIMAFFNGSTWDQRAFTAQVSLSLSGLAVGFHDVYANWTGSAIALSTVAWTNTYQKRATAAVLQDGVAVKSGATSYRLVGFIYVPATGTVNQMRNCAENGVISIQDMPRAEYEHSFYGEHTGWTIPWSVVPMIRWAQSRGGQPPRVFVQKDSAGFGSFSNPVGGMCWNFRHPHKQDFTYNNSSSGTMISAGPGSMFVDTGSYSGSSSVPTTSLPNSGNLSGQTRRAPYDPVGHKHYVQSGAISQVYKWDPSALSFSTPAGLNKSVGGWKMSSDYVPSNRKIYMSDQTNLYALDTSADTFGSSIVAETSNNGYRAAWHPIANKLFFRASSSTVKVLDCTNDTVSATVTLSANNYFGGGDISDCVYCPTTELIYVFGYANGDSINVGRCVVLDGSGNIQRIIQISSQFYPQHVDYVAGWDCFVMYGTAASSAGTNDTTSSRIATLSPHHQGANPTTSWASTKAVGHYGECVLTPGIYIEGATPTPGYFYHQCTGGIWIPTVNHVRVPAGWNASGSSITYFTINAIW